MGTAILSGLLANPEPSPHLGTAAYTNGAAGKSRYPKQKDERIPSRFIACVRTAESAKRLAREVEHFATPVTVLHGENLRAVEEADYVLLGCQPQDLEACIGSAAMLRALQGKLVVSILAGVTIPQLEALLDRSDNRPLTNGNSVEARHAIVRAMPNTASMVQASTTVITSSTSSSGALSIVDWLFSAIGSVTYISESVFDACTALCGSTPAFFALFLESLVDGAVNLGLKRSDAQAMAAGTMKGTAQMILSGQHPAIVRENVATPGGSTIKGLHKLEEGRLRAVVAGALMDCTKAAEALGGAGNE